MNNQNKVKKAFIVGAFIFFGVQSGVLYGMYEAAGVAAKLYALTQSPVDETMNAQRVGVSSRGVENVEELGECTQVTLACMGSVMAIGMGIGLYAVARNVAYHNQVNQVAVPSLPVLRHAHLDQAPCYVCQDDDEQKLGRLFCIPCNNIHATSVHRSCLELELQKKAKIINERRVAGDDLSGHDGSFNCALCRSLLLLNFPDQDLHED